MRSLLVLLVLSLMSSTLHADDAPVIVEFFTSEGCSSCPPADRVLTSLVEREDVLPLGFHVDYWNRLGWEDRFSAKAYTARQYQYAQLFGSKGVYTPQAVIGGVRETLGSDPKAIERSVEAVAPADGELTVEVTADDRERTLAITAGPETFRINAVLVQPGATTKVGRGENAGRSLAHANLVRDLAVVLPDANRQAVATLTQPDDVQDAFLVVYSQAKDGRILATKRIDP